MIHIILCVACGLIGAAAFIVNVLLSKGWQRAIMVVIVGITTPVAVLSFYAWLVPSATPGDKYGMTLFLTAVLFLPSWALAADPTGTKAQKPSALGGDQLAAH